MPYYKAVIEVLIEVNSEAEACDAISETMRPMLRNFDSSGQSEMIDWRYYNGDFPSPHNGNGFEYADPAISNPPKA